jgi:hypothetical protein
MFEKRRQMMTDWGCWCEPRPGNVVSLMGKTAAARV